jgi:two-component system phosphate regulon sensor histidine kinase PhoR
MWRIWRLRWYLLFALMLLALVVNGTLALIMDADWAILGQAVALVLFLTGSILLYSDARRNEEHRRVLLGVGEELAKRPELSDLLDYIVTAILKLVPLADKCVIHLLDEPGRRLYPRYSSHPAWEPSVGMPAHKGIAGQALLEGHTRVVADTRGDPEFLPLHSSADLRALMVAPLIAQGKPLGTISLNSKTPGAFTDRDSLLVTTLAAQASAAIHQTQLYAKAMDEAHYVEAIINNLADGLVVLDAEDRVLRYNPSLAHILGVDVSNIVGQKVNASSEDEGLRRLAAMIGDLPRGSNQMSERQVETKEPVHAFLRVHASSVVDQHGNREQIILLHDQTEELDLAHARACLVEAAARELRPPLESIRGYATLLLGFPVPGRGAQWAAQIREETAQLVRLVGDLTDLCSLESNALRTKPEPTDIKGLIVEALAEVAQPLQRKALSADVQFPPDLPSLSVDQDRLRHVLLNLLGNAIHRGVAGGHVSIRVEASLEELTFAVSDDGQPVPPEAQARVFQGPYRSDSASPDDPVGTGLGLYISRRIIEGLGGHLWFSQPGDRGARFQFILPLGAPQAR